MISLNRKGWIELVTQTKKMVRTFLSPPRIGRQFDTQDKHGRHAWQIERIMQKMSQADKRYEIIARFIRSESQ